MDNVTLECSTTEKQSIDWSVASVFQHKLGYSLGYTSRRIYTTCDVILWFEITGRYHVSRTREQCLDQVAGSMHDFNMTIQNMNLSETGSYKCLEDNGLGDMIIEYNINVLGKTLF